MIIKTLQKQLTDLPRRLLVVLIVLYQRIVSPLIHSLFPGSGCRFTPTCSQYAQECLHHHGVLLGTWRSVLRLSRCHPFHPGGFDPPTRS